MSLGIIIQARRGSKRLPNKVLLKLGKKTILEHVIERVKKVNFTKKIIIATTIKKKDEKIAQLAKINNCFFFKGSEKNVLQRYYECSKKFKLNTIIRICSDSPFIDPKIIDKAYKIFSKKKYDYVSNIVKPSYPAGMSVEIFNFKSLKKANEAKTDKKEEEHVTPFIYRNDKMFQIKNFETKKNYKNYRFSIDFKKDFIAMKNLYEIIVKSKRKQNTLNHLVKLMDENPNIKKINYYIKTPLRY
jgi:spore coat polysaccharide biosynthesis protein SpsF